MNPHVEWGMKTRDGDKDRDMGKFLNKMGAEGYVSVLMSTHCHPYLRSGKELMAPVQFEVASPIETETKTQKGKKYKIPMKWKE